MIDQGKAFEGQKTFFDRLLAFGRGKRHMCEANVFLRPSASVQPASVDHSV